MSIRSFKGKSPQFDESCYIDQDAVLIGDICLGKNCSIWPCAVIRADVNKIQIGDNVSIQDNCVLHVSKAKSTKIGSNTVIGHGAIIHSCEIGENCVIGMGATILEGAKIAKGAVIGANSLVREGQKIGEMEVAVGVPAVVKKKADNLSLNIHLLEEYSSLLKDLKEDSS
ncbi:gamma carbonic anhydrase family protein [Candidatus Undinarchaeota archaeon]